MYLIKLSIMIEKVNMIINLYMNFINLLKSTLTDLIVVSQRI